MVGGQPWLIGLNHPICVRTYKKRSCAASRSSNCQYSRIYIQLGGYRILDDHHSFRTRPRNRNCKVGRPGEDDRICFCCYGHLAVPVSRRRIERTPCLIGSDCPTQGCRDIENPGTAGRLCDIKGVGDHGKRCRCFLDDKDR